MRVLICMIVCCAAFFSGLQAQLMTGRPASFSHADSLRGGLSPERTCYDVRFYHLDVRVDPSSGSIQGSVLIDLSTVTETNVLRVDLFKNMEIDQITLDKGEACTFRRDEHAVFVSTPRALRGGERHALTVVYHGKPIVARMPPWDGGFIWKKDSSGTPWVAVTCQGTGASLWWPNKDHPADEPDSMLISVTVPPGLEDVSNGRLRAKRVLEDGWTRFDWFVGAPINNYSVTVNVGKFAHWSETWTAAGGGEPLTIDYYVLPQDLEKARRQFVQVKPMLQALERYFGPYPFRADGYKLVQSPHLGMEHQSCIAYGNGFQQGYHGRASSAVGLTFDFIIVHESAHEWWGNSVTAADLADMWIHESFGAYAEALFVEYWHGRDTALQYINAKRQNVRNDAPMQGPYGVNKEGSGDMYDKGQLVLNTLRTAIDNDSLWFSILRGMQQEFRWKVISYDAVVQYINRVTGKDFGPFFTQYYRHATLPVFQATVTRKGQETTVRYRWEANDPAFAMPVRVRTAPGRTQTITPTADWNVLKLETGADPAAFGLEEQLSYCDKRITHLWLDERVPARRGP